MVSIAERRSGAIKLTALDAQPEPRNLRRVTNEVLVRWGTVPLVDMLKETVLRTGCLDAVTSGTTGGSIRPDVPAERLLLAIYAYGTNTGGPDAYPRLAPALTRPIRRGIVEEQYDQMIKYATAIRTGTASTESDPAALHPQRLAPNLRRDARGRSRPEDDLHRALPAVARSATRDRGRPERRRVLERSQRRPRLRQTGDIQTNRRDEQELFVLCLRILQAALVYLNTLMLQDILDEPPWAEMLTPADRRGLTPLIEALYATRVEVARP